MDFYVMTLFPEMVEHALSTSITGRAMDKGIISLNAVNIRDYTKDRHRKVDDYTYGGGAGMLMTPQPVYDCYRAVTERIRTGRLPELSELTDETETTQISRDKKVRCVYLTPQGEVFNQSKAKELAREDSLILLCGHYEGIDERVLDAIVTDNISIGDYVLTGGELAAMVVCDAVSRMVPGVLTNEMSGVGESFEEGLLEYPQYTRPEVWMGKAVPPILISGDHAKVDKWRFEQSLERTRDRRPDLYPHTGADHRPRHNHKQEKSLPEGDCRRSSRHARRLPVFPVSIIDAGPAPVAEGAGADGDILADAVAV